MAGFVTRTCFALLLIASATRAQQCYFPNGDETPMDVPCTGGTVSHCCNPRDICLDNGYCLKVRQPFQLSRGSCTDRGWHSSRCPEKCRDFLPDGGSSITVLEWSRGQVNYCCGGVLANGTDGSLVCVHGEKFPLDDGDIIPGRAGLADLSNSSSTASDSTDDQKATKVAIGVGTGLPLALMAVALALWALWERRGKLRARHGVLAPSVDNGTLPVDSTSDVYKVQQQTPSPWNVPAYPTAELTTEGRPAELTTQGRRAELGVNGQ